MGELQQADRKRPDVELRVEGYDCHLDPFRQIFLSELARDQPGGEGIGVNRAIQVGREIGDRTDMVLRPVSQDDTGKVDLALLDERGVGHDDVDAGIFGRAETDAEVEHQPFPLTPVEVEVHANLARPAERQIEQFLAWAGHAAVRPFAWACNSAMPRNVKSGSTWSNKWLCS